ncbi:MAG: hypothetical protein KDD14_21585, partial [Saprospiraceae bacterium]|nr:hypothetical protein [Saprospiraceae bacterium]
AVLPLENHIPMKPKTKYALLAASLFLGLTGLSWWLYRRFFRDGLGPGGQWDAEGGATEQAPVLADPELSFAQKPIQLRHFAISEFDSKDLPGSGVNMKIKFLKMLDAAREEAGIPFRVNSGYRTAARNAAVGGVSNSAHLSGWAADISAGTLEQKTQIVRAARVVGFNRFGIYSGFIHLDCDPGKRAGVAWNGTVAGVFRGGDFSGFLFDPFSI